MTASPYLTIEAEHRSDRSVLRVSGELDVCNHEDLRRAIGEVLDHQPQQDLTIDLTQLRFTDCAGLSILVWAHDRLSGRGHLLTITGVRPNIRRLLRLTSLDTRLHVSPEPNEVGS